MVRVCRHTSRPMHESWCISVRSTIAIQQYNSTADCQWSTSLPGLDRRWPRRPIEHPSGNRCHRSNCAAAATDQGLTCDQTSKRVIRNTQVAIWATLPTGRYSHRDLYIKDEPSPDPIRPMLPVIWAPCTYDVRISDSPIHILCTATTAAPHPFSWPSSA